MTIQDQHALRRLKVLNNTSASAIDNWEQCPRQWFGGYVEGDRAPSSEAQQRGTTIDLEVQRHYKGEPVTKGWQDAVTGIVRLLPDKLRIQHKIVTPTYAGGPVVIGYPDFLDEPEEACADVLDLKSLSDYRYAKTPEQLRENTQMVTYAAWLWTLPGVRRVRAAHVAARFKRDHAHPVGYKFQGARLSGWAEMERDHVQEQWGKRLDTVRQMVEAARSAVAFEDLPPLGASNLDEEGRSTCERYQGCYFRGRCGFSVTMTLNKGASTMPSLMEQLEAQARAQGIAIPPTSPSVLLPPPDMRNLVQNTHPNAHAVSEGLHNNGQMLSVPGNGGQIVGGGGPPQNFAPNPNPNHAHPGTVLPPSAGYAPGQPCNGNGYYASSNGSGGFIAVEPGHQCVTCVGPQTIDPRQVLPPDAPTRTSTPAEIAAVVEGNKKGRPKKTATSEAATIENFVQLQNTGFTTQEITDIQRSGQLADALSGKLTTGMLRQPRPPVGYQGHVPAPVQTTEEPKVLPAPQVASPAVAAAQDAWYQNSGPTMAQQPMEALTPAPVPINNAQPVSATQTLPSAPSPMMASVRPPAGLVLLVDCAPTKGQTAVLLADWIAPVAEYACSQVVDDNGRPAPVLDLSLVPYARGKGYLAAAVKLALGTVPPVLAIDTSVYGADKVLELLTPWAATVIVGRGSAR